MNWTSFGLGFAVGVMCWRAFTALAIGLRQCCAAHFRTHATCGCRDCVADREFPE